MNSDAPDPSLPSELPDASANSVVKIFIGSDGLRAGWGILLFLFFCIALSISASLLQTLLFPHSFGAIAFNTPRGLFLGEGRMLAVVTLATLVMAKIERRPFAAYGFALRRGLRNFSAGLVWGLALLSLLVFALRASGLLVFDARLLHGTAALRYAAIWLVGFLLVGLFEESSFRGYLQFTLARGISGASRLLGARHSDAIGFWTAAMLLSFGFGFSHHTNPGESPIGLIAAALIAIVFCLSLWRTGSLWWAIGFHAAWDWAESFLFGVSDSGTVMVGRLFATHPSGHALLSGGLTGPEGSLYILPIVVLASAVIFFTLPTIRATNQPHNGLGSIDI
jgi:hypothetical protein